MSIKEHVAALAKKHGVKYVRTGTDALAEVITRLCDDEVVTDATEDTIIALRRSGVIDGPTMLDLLHRHLDEIYGTDPPVAASGDLGEDVGIEVDDGDGHGPTGA